MLLPKHPHYIMSLESRGKKSKKIITHHCLLLPNDGKWSNMIICCSFYSGNTACFGEDAQVTLAVKKQLFCQWKLPASQTSPVALQTEPAFPGQICGNFILSLIPFLTSEISAQIRLHVTCYVSVLCLLALLSALHAVSSQFCLDEHIWMVFCLQLWFCL